MMEFDNNRPIYLQIADNLCEKILSGAFEAGGRLPSVREWGATIGCNPNTVARSYDILSERKIIYNQRGIGFFIAENAVDIIRNSEKKIFIEEEIPALINRGRLLGLEIEVKYKDL